MRMALCLPWPCRSCIAPNSSNSTRPACLEGAADGLEHLVQQLRDGGRAVGPARQAALPAGAGARRQGRPATTRQGTAAGGAQRRSPGLGRVTPKQGDQQLLL